MNTHDHAFQLKPSKTYGILFLLIWLPSIGIVVLQPMPAWLRILLCMTLMIYGLHFIFRYILLIHRDALVSIRHLSDGQWCLQTYQGKTYHGKLREGSLVTRPICILVFKIPAHYRPLSCIIFADSLLSEQYQYLLRQLKSG